MKKKLLVIIILLSFLIRLAISWQEVPELIEKIVLDDSFYVISVARNIALGNGVTYNGADVTNGFQPLWGVILAPVFLMTDNLQLAVNIILTIATILDTLTVFMLFKLSEKLFGKKIGLMSAALYGLNPFIMFQSLNGIEMVLYVFLVITTLFYYCNLDKKMKNKNLIVLGALIGLTLLSRLDGIFLLMAILADMLWKSKKKLITGIKRGALVVIVAGLVVSPWFLWNYATFGSIVQSSAVAKYNMGHGIFPFLNTVAPESISDSLSMITENIVRSAGAVAHQFGVIDFNSNFITIIISLFVSVTLLYSLSSFKRLNVFILYALLLLSFYNIYFWGVQIRYLTPIMPMIIMMASYGFYNLVKKIKKNDVLMAAIFVLFILLLVNNGIRQWDKGYYNWQSEMYEDALWIKGNTTPSTIVGSFNSGIYIYFSERKVVNIDGVVNFKAIEALENKNVVSYMKSENVTIWVENSLFNQSVADAYLEGREVDVLKENIWVDRLGDGKENLELIEQRINIYEHLRGFDMLFVFFKARLN
ncbi:MAG: glycosyltransferase family 39 protein [Candidatus Aenigmatarchaeota archaeon]